MPPTSERADVEEELDAFRAYWLAPARVAPPTIDFEERLAEAGPVQGSALPIRAEEASWNTWSGDESRLFNNRAAHLFRVEVRGPGPLRWVPGGTSLELNVEGDGLRPAPAADDVLGPLLIWAKAQAEWTADGDLVERTRAAGPFRSAYLPLSAEDSPLEGLIAFPIDEPDHHVVALRLTVEVEAAGVRHQLSWLYD